VNPSTQLHPKKIKTFQKKILTWYGKNKRDLPWREIPAGISLQQKAYQILISEVMSQQTQLTRVVPKYIAWLEEFPTIQDLAQATVADVLRSWSGLGYNRRALNLKKAAEIIVKEYQGEFPQVEKELLVLPGIGKYTAGAVLCFAFNQQVAVVDTNVRKVMVTQFLDSRLRGNDNISDKEMQQIAEQLLPKGKAYEWNQALMDYAGAVLKKEKIAIPKQSKFIGSRRYYRGQVLKILLQKKQIACQELGELLKKKQEKGWLEKLLFDLQQEGFILIQEELIQLRS